MGYSWRFSPKRPAKQSRKTKITLYQGLPKADKMELIIQKCVELGVERIVAVSTERAIVKLDKRKAKSWSVGRKLPRRRQSRAAEGRFPKSADRC